MRWGGANCPGNQFTESYKYQSGRITYKRLRAPALTAGNYTTSADNLDASFSYGNEGQLAYIHYPTWYNLQGTPGQNLTLTYTFDTWAAPSEPPVRTRPVGQQRHLLARWRAHRGHLRGNARSVRLHLLQRNPLLQRARAVDAADRGQPRRLEYSFSATNNDGRITKEKDWLSGKEVNYQYDTLGRLTSAATTGPQWGQSFAYDGFGNLTAEVATKGTAPTTYLAYNGTTNRITTAGYGYDSTSNRPPCPT